jgi:hypothetical protein
LADEKRRVTIEEWHREARSLFGDDPNAWKFICPSCGFVQTRRDFLAYGVPERDVDRRLAFSCIGRTILDACPTADVVDFMDPHRGFGCNYAGGGLFRINPVEVVYDPKQAEVHTVFEFAREPR